MTREEFDDMRADILNEIEDATEHRRVAAVSYEEAVLNARDGIPAFGWPPSIPQADREALMAMMAHEYGLRRKTIQ